MLVDKYENWAVIVYTLQLPSVCRVALRTVVLGAFGDTHYALAVGLPILALELGYMCRLFLNMRALLGRRGCTALPPERLRVRLEYLTSKYAPHAAYWQFVLWLRQLALVGVSEGFEAYKTSDLVLVEAAAALAVLVATLALHCRVRPYAYGYQNRLEVLLASCSVIALVGGCVFYGHTHGAELSPAATGGYTAFVVLLLLGPVAVVVVVASVRLVGHVRALEAAIARQMQEPLLEEEPGEGVLDGGDAGMPAHPSTTSINAQGGALSRVE